MPLSKEQISKLLMLVASSDSDSMDCDGCMERIAEFAEIHLLNREVPEALACVQRHLEQCPCCMDEFNALKDALSGVDE